MSKLKQHLIIAFIAITTCLYSCNFTSTRNYDPDLNGKQKPVVDSINSKYSFEDINMVGQKTSGTKGDHNTLTIKFMNGKNIPADNNKMKGLAKQLLINLKGVLKDPKQFDGYSVYFVSGTSNGVITNTKSVGFEFEPSDLN